MPGRRRLYLLLGLIALELLISALVLRWTLAPEERQEPAVPAPAESRVTARPPVALWLDPDLPAHLSQAVPAWLAESGTPWAWGEPGEGLAAGWQKRPGARPIARVVLVAAVPFASLREEVSLAELRRAWLGRSQAEDGIVAIVAPPETIAALASLLGPSGALAAVTAVPAAEIPARLATEAGACAVVPFDALVPGLKPLAVDGQWPLDRDLEADGYPLAATVWAGGPAGGHGVQDLAAWLAARGEDTNRHLDRLTVLAMTGVTALTRGVAVQIEAHGDPGWPARRIGDLLAGADLTHVSNEVSFVPGCPAQRETQAFCARPEYMEVLRLVGADLVELTGNHNCDLGSGPALQSLALYAEAGLPTFGGGRDEVEARRPLLITHNGNRLAFLGYNQFGPDYAWAGSEKPGAARFSVDAVRSDIAQVRATADLVLVNVQHTEVYATAPAAGQVADFRAIVDAGADVVTGSQAHQPQAMEWYAGKPIFYGLGNLFFDQTWSEETRQGLVVRHYVYQGRLLSIELIPTTMDADFQTYPAAGAEREAILKAILPP